MKLHYEIYDFSKPWLKKTPLILIHGIAANLKMWFFQVPEFSKEFPVILIDLPGHGKSPEPEKEMTIEDIAKSVHETLKEIGVSKVNMLGISMGAVVALEYASAYSHQIDKLILASMPGMIPNDVKPMLQALIEMNKTASRDEIVSNFFKNYNAFGIDKSMELFDFAYEMFAQTKHSAYMKVVGWGLVYHLNSKFKTIRNKTLVMNGEIDNLTPCMLAEAASKEMQDATFHVLKNTGHICSMDNPEEFNKKVLEFLK